MSSYLLQIWQHPLHLPPLKTYADAVRSLEQAQQVSLDKPSPAFVALAEALLKIWPSKDMFGPGDPQRNDSIWMNSPLKEAREMVDTAAWGFGMPREETEAVVIRLLEAARPLGLTVLNDESEIAWLPSGQILPPEKAEDWNGYVEDVKAEPPKRTKAQVKKIVRTKLTAMLGKYGFEASQDKKHYEGSDFYFVRQAQVCQQVISGAIKVNYGEHELSLSCRGIEEHAQEILVHVFGPNAEGGGDIFLTPMRNWAMHQAANTVCPLKPMPT